MAIYCRNPLKKNFRILQTYYSPISNAKPLLNIGVFEPHFAQWKTQPIDLQWWNDIALELNFLSTLNFLIWLGQSCMETSYFEIEILSLTGCWLVIANIAVLFRLVHSCSFLFIQGQSCLVFQKLHSIKQQTTNWLVPGYCAIMLFCWLALFGDGASLWPNKHMLSTELIRLP